MESVLAGAVGALATVSVSSVGALVWVIKKRNNHSSIDPELKRILDSLSQSLNHLSSLPTTLREVNTTLVKVSDRFMEHDKDAAVRHEILMGTLARQKQ